MAANINVECFDDVKTNYVEIHIGKLLGTGFFQYSLSSDEFFNYMDKMQKKYDKCFQTDHKEYILNNMRLIKQVSETGDVDDTKVNMFHVLKTDVLSSELMMVIYDKKKLPIVGFPSTSSLSGIKHVRRLIFRVNNRIFVNFQEEKVHGSEEMCYRLFVNYNHSDGVDLKESVSKINMLINCLVS